MLNNINKYLGWRNWAVFQYNSIFENLFILFSILLLNGHTTVAVLIDILVFAIFSILSTSYGYLINDYADRELDARHQKANTFSDDSTLKAVFVTGLIFVLSAATAVRFINKPFFIGLWITWLLLSTFYSLPPLRLKERGKSGLLAAVTAQRFIPVLMVFSIFEPVGIWFLVLAGAYVFFRGLSSDLNHQVEDYSNDVQTDTQTFAVTSGLSRGKRILRFSLETEKLLLPVVLIYTVLKLKDIQDYLLVLTVTLVLLYCAGYFYSIFQVVAAKNKPDVNPFNPDQKTIFQFLHHSYPSVILPLGLNVILSFLNPWFIILLGLQMWMRGLFSFQVIEQSFIFNIFKRG